MQLEEVIRTPKHYLRLPGEDYTRPQRIFLMARAQRELYHDIGCWVALSDWLKNGDLWLLPSQTVSLHGVTLGA
jgi:hypothetical protein